MYFFMAILRTRTRTRTNTNPNGTEADAAGRSERAKRGERKLKYVWTRDAPDRWAGRGRVRECKALVWGGVISEVGYFFCLALPRGGFV
jgi:hypothetical protein